jgi:cytosine/adenosine deaminase-related metal-dependent hydrolase
LIVNVDYALIGQDLDIIEKAHIEIIDGIIAHIGRGHVVHGNHVSVNHGIAIPSLVNAHIHIFDYAFLEYGIELDLSKLVREPYGLKHKLLAMLTRDDIFYACRRVLEKLLRSGVATTIIFSELAECGEVKKLAQELEIDAVVLGRSRASRVFTSIKDILRVADGLGLDSPLRYSRGELKYMRMECNRFSKLVSTHVAETKSDYEYGDFKIALDYLEPELMVHGVHLSEEDIQLLSEKEISIVICPRSNMWFDVGIPPVRKLLENNVNVLLGTDNAGVIEPNIWRELETTYNILRMQGGIYVDPKEILKMVTTNVTKIKRLGSKVSNVIDEGCKANFTILDSYELGVRRSQNIYATIVKRGSPSAVRCLIRGNKKIEIPA